MSRSTGKGVIFVDDGVFIAVILGGRHDADLSVYFEEGVETYRSRAEIERYSHKASFDEIEANGFNLNIPRYVDTFEPEPEIDLQTVQDEIRDLEAQLAETRAKMNAYLKELGINV